MVGAAMLKKKLANQRQATTRADNLRRWRAAHLQRVVGAVFSKHLSQDQLRQFRLLVFFFSSRRRHTRWTGDWSSDVCSSDLCDRLPEWGLSSRDVARALVA